LRQTRNQGRRFREQESRTAELDRLGEFVAALQVDTVYTGNEPLTALIDFNRFRKARRKHHLASELRSHGNRVGIIVGIDCHTVPAPKPETQLDDIFGYCPTSRACVEVVPEGA